MYDLFEQLENLIMNKIIIPKLVAKPQQRTKNGLLIRQLHFGPKQIILNQNIQNLKLFNIHIRRHLFLIYFYDSFPYPINKLFKTYLILCQ